MITRASDLRCTHVAGLVQDLALQIGNLDLVRVGDEEPADPRCSQVEGGRAAKAARTRDQDLRSIESPLSLDAEFVEQDVARVAQQLLVPELAWF